MRRDYRKTSAGKLSSLLFARSKSSGDWGDLAKRIVLAVLWLNADLPRWAALFAGHPLTHRVATGIFGPTQALAVTYYATTLETVAAILLIFGFLTRVGALWGVIEFFIIGAYGWTLAGDAEVFPTIWGRFQLLKDFGLMTASLSLLQNGSFMLSIDGLIAKRRGNLNR